MDGDYYKVFIRINQYVYHNVHHARRHYFFVLDVQTYFSLSSSIRRCDLPVELYGLAEDGVERDCMDGGNCR